MKNVFVILGMMGFSLLVNAQQSVTPPSVVKMAFSSVHATQPSWSKDKDVYIATFTDQEGTKAAFYNTDGTWIKTQQEVPLNTLSKSVRDEIDNRFLGQNSKYEFLTSYKVDAPDGKLQAAKFKTGNAYITIYFTEDGKMIRREFVQ